MIFHHIDQWNFRLLVNEFYQIAIGLSVITYFHISKDYYHLAQLTKWTLYFLVITASLTIVASFIDPLFARKITHILVLSEAEREVVLDIQKYGPGDYSTAIAFMAIIPLLIYYLKHIDKSIFKKWQIIVFLAILLTALVRMQIFANILLAFIFAFFALFGTKNIKFSIFISMIVILLVFIIPINPTLLLPHIK